METFKVTFSQAHPLRDHWIEVDAVDEAKAREKVFETFGPKFAFIYSTKDFNPDYFPAGRVGRILR